MKKPDAGGLFMHETEAERFEKNCAFFGGHFFSANPGVQSCLWCIATRNSTDEVQADE